MTTKDFLEWLQTAQPGAVFNYHVGSLCSDREPKRISTGNETDVVIQDRVLDEIAREVYQAYNRGQVIPVQRKLGPGQYAYYAIRAKHRLR